MSVPNEPSPPSPPSSDEPGKVDAHRVALYLRLGISAAILVGVVLATVLIGLRLSSSVTALLSIAEIEILAFTILVLLLLSLYTSQSFSRDTQKIVGSFGEQSRALLDRSREHWAEQSRALTEAIVALDKVVEAENAQMILTRDTLQATKDMLNLERERERVRAEEAALRRQRIRPSLAIQPFILHPGPIAKHIGLHIFNQGEDGRRVLVTLRQGPGPSTGVDVPRTDLPAYSTVDFDFGEIDTWPDAFPAIVDARLTDVDGNAYACSVFFGYDRQRGWVLSNPVFTPPDWQYPPMTSVP